MCNLTKRDIQKLSNGQMPASLKGKPFAVIRQSVKLLLSDSQSWQWEVVTSPKDTDATEIERQTALDIIRENDMKLTYSSIHGQVYETPGKPFHETYTCQKRKSKRAAS